MIAGPSNETRLTGLPISPGVVVGRVCLFRQDRHNDLPSYQVSDKGVARERERLRQAMELVAQRLEGLRQAVASRIGAAEAGIFQAQKMIVQDPTLAREMDEALIGGCNAETAVLRTLDRYELQLTEIDDAYLRERASDLGEIKRRLLDVLCNARPAFECSSGTTCRRGKDRIVITEDLTPATTLAMETGRLLGFVTERGGAASHAGILARALGIPAVSGIPNIHNLVPCGAEVLLDGGTGEVVLWPSAETKARANRSMAVARPRGPVAPVESLRVMANISVAAEAEGATEMQAEGIGLYRTEFEFFAAGRLLDEDEQYARYSQVVEAMAGRCVYFRLLDVGADKTVAAFDLPAEENPALGCRGMRLLLARPDLLRQQARALVRTSAHGSVHVMYPMIVSLRQFSEARELFEEAVADLPAGDVRHGVMFETPAAFLQRDELLAAADFASVGTNDLVQYLFAVDRNNERVAADYTPDQAVFWAVLEDLARSADRAGKPLSVCGELAADPQYTARLLSLGIGTVSVSARRIPAVRRAAAEAVAADGPGRK